MDGPAHPPQFFFTHRLKAACAGLLVTHIDVLRDVTRSAMAQGRFEIEAAVILPDRLHMIWRMPGRHDFTKDWRAIRSGFSRHVPRQSPETAPQSVWQPGYWHHHLQGDGDIQRHRHLISAAPVQAGLAKGVGDWPYSSFCRRRGGARTIAPVPSSPDPEVLRASK